MTYMFLNRWGAFKMQDNHTKDTLIWLGTYLKPYKHKFIIIILLVCMATLFSVITPVLLQKAIDALTIKSSFSFIKNILLLLLFCYLIRSIINWITNKEVVNISETILYELRRDLLSQLETLDISYFDQNQKGDIMSHFTGDILQIGDAITETIIEMISSIILLIGVTVIMFFMNWMLAITVIITVPIFFLLVFKIGKKINDYFLLQQNLVGKMSGLGEELVSGMKSIQSMNSETTFFEKFELENEELCKVSMNAQIYSGFIMPINTMVTNIGNVLLILVGTILILKGKTTIGMILAFLNFASMFRNPINNLAGLFTNISEALAGATRIYQILQTPKLVLDEGTISNKMIFGAIDFEHVTFGYDKDKPILKDISFHVTPGTVTAIVGPTGAGKTTIANLLTRFYDVEKGKIMIDEYPIEDYKIPFLREKIGIVLQDTYLFKGTVKDNIKYGKENATDDEIVLASKIVCAHEFIHRLKDGYNSIVEENGSNLSEGERQLIAIARVFLMNPDILILDEATSSIDTKTECNVQKGLSRLMEKKTCLVIAHRLSTIQNADQILVLSNGQIVESGSHEMLFSQHGIYSQLYMSQFEN